VTGQVIRKSQTVYDLIIRRRSKYEQLGVRHALDYRSNPFDLMAAGVFGIPCRRLDSPASGYCIGCHYHSAGPREKGSLIRRGDKSRRMIPGNSHVRHNPRQYEQSEMASIHYSYAN
jgi:hypothetical protein